MRTYMGFFCLARIHSILKRKKGLSFWPKNKVPETNIHIYDIHIVQTHFGEMKNMTKKRLKM